MNLLEGWSFCIGDEHKATFAVSTLAPFFFLLLQCRMLFICSTVLNPKKAVG